MAKGKYKTWLDKEHLLLIEGWARDGLTDDQIAHNIKIRRETLYQWKKKYPNISNALKSGKEVVDRQVENALLKRALGTTITNKSFKMVKVDQNVLNVKRVRFANEYKLNHPEANLKEIQMAAVEKVPTYERIQLYENTQELAPDVSAAIFWLKNRKPKQYRDQTFAELNEAQTAKAKSDAKLSEARVKQLSEDVTVVPEFHDDVPEEDDED